MAIPIASNFQTIAVNGLAIKADGTNAVLTWQSSPGNLFLVESEPVLNVGFQWSEVTNYFPAAANTNIKGSFIPTRLGMLVWWFKTPQLRAQPILMKCQGFLLCRMD